jgi:putative oxidoreductase
MNLRYLLKKLDNAYHPKWFALLRILLGLSLFVKGILFVYNKSLIEELVRSNRFIQGNEWLQTIIPWMHLLGGVFIIIGLFTRLAVLVQIPILIGAIVFVNATKGVYVGQSELMLAIILLIILLFFLVEGGGPLSWDKFIRKEKDGIFERKRKTAA